MAAPLPLPLPLPFTADRRRNPPPAISLLPLPVIAPHDPCLVAATRSRSRPLEALRPMFMKTSSIVPVADGSAFVESGALKVVCAVYGPRAAPSAPTERGRISVDLRFAAFSGPKRRAPAAKDSEERELSALLQGALAPAVVTESFPKAAVDVHVTVLESDGKMACLAAAVNAATLALADAGVAMLDLVTGCSASVTGAAAPAVVVMDPCQSEEEGGAEVGPGQRVAGRMFLAYMPSLGQVTQIIQTGEIDKDVATEMMDMCIDACAEVHGALKACLIEGATADKAVVIK